jgi:quinol monooxygenase YgiN
MIVGTLRILPSSERHAEVLEIFQAIQGPVLAQPGCAACTIYEEQGPEHAVVLVESWETREALERHLRSDAYRLILGAIELSDGQPEIRFDHVSATEGIELISRTRNL